MVFGQPDDLVATLIDTNFLEATTRSQPMVTRKLDCRNFLLLRLEGPSSRYSGSGLVVSKFRGRGCLHVRLAGFVRIYSGTLDHSSS
jgi:hypothetical protein